jgi:hypothetical protein
VIDRMSLGSTDRPIERVCVPAYRSRSSSRIAGTDGGEAHRAAERRDGRRQPEAGGSADTVFATTAAASTSPTTTRIYIHAAALNIHGGRVAV